MSPQEAAWRDSTIHWLHEALAELHTIHTLPPLPVADENVPLVQVRAHEPVLPMMVQDTACADGSRLHANRVLLCLSLANCLDRLLIPSPGVVRVAPALQSCQPS